MVPRIGDQFIVTTSIPCSVYNRRLGKLCTITEIEGERVSWTIEGEGEHRDSTNINRFGSFFLSIEAQWLNKEPDWEI